MPTGFRRRFEFDGFVGGIHAGYNRQFGRFVAGLEADAEIADVRGGYVTPRGIVFSSRQPWQASVRARAGLTLGGGAEYAVTDKITIRAEYRHTDFGSFSYDWPLVGATPA